MIFLSTENYVKQGVTTDTEKLFLARWLELFDDGTYDSWQVRYACPHSILDELEAAVDVLHHVPTAYHNVDVLLAETKMIFGTDPIIPSQFSLAAGLLDSLKVDGIKKGEAAAPRVGLKNQISVIRHVICEYHAILIEALVSTLRSNGDEKKHLLLLTERLASRLSRVGYTASYLSTLFNAQDEGKTPFADRVENALTNLSLEDREYVCYCKVKWPNHASDFKGVDIGFVQSDDPSLITEQGCLFQRQDRAARILQITVRAHDPFAARERAYDVATQMNGAFRIYMPSRRRQIKIYPGVLVQDADVYNFVGSDESRLGHVRDTTKPEKGVANILRLKESNFKDYAILLSSFQYHLLHVQSETDESRLVNLWIALETLLPRHGRGIIEAVSDMVPNSVCSIYLRKICFEVGKGLRNVLREKPDMPLPDWMKRSTRDRIHPGDVLFGMTDKKDGLRIKSLFDLCADQPLLIHRLNNLWEELFCTPTTMAARLKKHRQHVEWQLRRIYRARNYVMHTGRSDSGIRHLIQHLHTYYLDFVHNLLRDLRDHNFKTIDEALTYRISAHSHLITRLERQHPSPKIYTSELFQLRFGEKDDDDDLIFQPETTK